MEALGINLGYLFVQIFNFLIVLVVLRAWVYKPVVGLLEKRRETIAQGLEDARVAAEARDNAEKEAESVVAAAQQEANKIEPALHSCIGSCKHSGHDLSDGTHRAGRYATAKSKNGNSG